MKVCRPLRMIGVVFLFLLISLGYAQPTNAETTQSVNGGSQACPKSELSYNLPHEVEMQNGSTQEQIDFQCYSWQSFVALNWPAGKENGQPDTSKKFGQFGDDGLVTWETNWEPSRLFLPNGIDPCEGLSPKDCWNRQSGNKSFYMTSKSGGFLDAHSQAVPNAWLTDQNHNLTRYEILLNQDEFNYILKNKLYNEKGQKDFNKSVDMPVGQNSGPVGPIEFKAAWKILTEEEKTSGKYFIHENAEIRDTKVNPFNGYPDAQNGKYMTCGDVARCSKDVGLVGLHIAHKVKGFPSWVWSTFEHIDNAPVEGNADPGIQYSFYNQACGKSPACSPNTNPRKIPIPVSTPNQVTRVIQKVNLQKDVNDVNKQWHQMVGDTVWKNYELIGTQWVTTPDHGSTQLQNPVQNPPDLTKPGTDKPTYLANSVMETYIQTADPNTPGSTPSSCLNCHRLGATLTGKDADFSFLFSTAKSD